MASDDYGKDLTNVQNLQKKHALLEADVAAHQVECGHCWASEHRVGRLKDAVIQDQAGLGRDEMC